MISIKSLAFLATVASLLAACSSTPVNAPGLAAPPTARSTPGVGAPAQSATQQPAPASSATSVALPAHLDPKSSISTERSVYFDFDEFVVKTEYSGLIDRHGKYLSIHLAIKIEAMPTSAAARYNLLWARSVPGRAARCASTVKASQMEATSWGGTAEGRRP
jgi:peptidoglycan-associated lipoprotein